MLTAWADESGSRPDRDPHTYLLAAVLVDDCDVDVVRKTMAALRLPIEKKLHWYGSSDERRHQLVHAISALPIIGVVVVHHEQGASERRHRRKCMEHLVPQLDRMPCSCITFESRGPQDNSDVDIVQKFRARKIVTASLRIHHCTGRSEPLLWLADIICGAVVQHRIGNLEYLDVLGGLIDMCNI